MDQPRTYTTSRIASAVGIHPNTVRLYERIGFITAPERLANGYRVFTDLHLLQVRLVRDTLNVELVQNGLRREVLAVDNCECQECKRRGVYSKASIVHHVRHLRDRPDLALSVYDGDSRQLEAVCKRCHEGLHPDSQRQYAPPAPPLTPERWD